MSAFLSVHLMRAVMFLVLLCLLSPVNLFAAVVTGTISDAKTGEPIPFATVRVEGTGKSMLANENGTYRLSLPEGRYQLKFSHVAHYSERIELVVDDTLVVRDISLHPSVIKLPGVKVYDKSYEPAQKIILEAIARKEELLAKIHAYSLEAYIKLLVRDTMKDDSDNIMMIHEEQIVSHWEYPHKYKEIVKARRETSNLENVMIFAPLGELLNFNESRLDFGGNRVVSPTAEDALDYYTYYLLDTVYLDSQRVFRLEIEPKSESVPLLEGTIDIADSSYAVVGVDVGFNDAFEIDFMENFRYRERYAQFENEYWMPIETHFSGIVKLPIPGLPVMSFEYVASLHNFTFNKTHPPGTFDEYRFEVPEGVDKVDSATWEAGQRIPLTPEEVYAYHRIDSLVHAPKPLYRKALRVGLGLTYLAMGGDARFFRFNRVEGAYLGVELSTKAFVPRIRFKLGGGYAFSAKRWEYTGALSYAFPDSKRWRLYGEYHSKITRRRTVVSSNYADATLGALWNKSDPFDYYRQRGFFGRMTVKVVPHLKISFGYADDIQNSVKNHSEFSLFDSDKKNRPNPPIIEGRLRAVSAWLYYDSRSLWKYKGSERHISTGSYTLATLAAEAASPDVIPSDFHYTRYSLWLYRKQVLFGYGTTRFELYAGLSAHALPPQKYFIVDYGSGVFESRHTFKTLGRTNFYGSRAAMTYASHNFGRALFRKSGLPGIKKIPFSLFVYGGVFWTDFLNHSFQGGEEIPTFAPKPYREIGFGIGDITPWNGELYFTWQLSSYDTKRFSLDFNIRFF